MSSPEFKSAIVRIGMWLFASVYIGVASYSGCFQDDTQSFYWLFSTYLMVSLGFMLSVLRRPFWPGRVYLGLLVDICAVSITIYLTGEAVSPFFLLYIWIFVGYGARYGRSYLNAASILSLLAYGLVLLVIGEGRPSPLESTFYLLVLFALPLYQRQLLGQIYQAKQEADRSGQARERFFSTLTNELRIPLSGIQGTTESLRDTQLTRQQEEYVYAIASSAALLNAMIGDVLDFSRIDTSGLQLEITPFELRPAIRDVCEALSNQALDKRLELICQIDSRLPRVAVGDEMRLKQILFNLVGNAIKFTERGQVVVKVMSLERRDKLGQGCLRIEVRDTGIGIDSAQQIHVFERFWQAAPDRPGGGGTGLGTTIARNLTRLMGGRIGLESKRGEGSVFWLELPLLIAEFPERLQLNNGRALRALAFETNLHSLQSLRDTCTELRILCQPVARIADLAEVVSGIGESDEGIDLALVADAPEGIDVQRIADVIREHLGGQLPVIYLSYRSRRLRPEATNTAFVTKPVTADLLWPVIARLLNRPG